MFFTRQAWQKEQPWPHTYTQREDVPLIHALPFIVSTRKSTAAECRPASAKTPFCARQMSFRDLPRDHSQPAKSLLERSDVILLFCNENTSTVGKRHTHVHKVPLCAVKSATSRQPSATSPLPSATFAHAKRHSIVVKSHFLTIECRHACSLAYICRHG